MAMLFCTLLPTAMQFARLDAPPVLASPVFSLATLDESGNSNMNLLTYASPVGIRPHRLWAISLFRKTRTHANFARRKTGVLQQLTTAHASLTHILGGTSAADPGVDKAAKCAAHGFPWSEGPNSDAFGACGEKLLPECYSYLRLTLEGDLLDAGDHDIALCRVEEVFAPPPPPEGVHKLSYPPLSTSDLRNFGLITAQGRTVDPDAPKSVSEEPYPLYGNTGTSGSAIGTNGAPVGLSGASVGTNGIATRAHHAMAGSHCASPGFNGASTGANGASTSMFGTDTSVNGAHSPSEGFTGTAIGVDGAFVTGVNEYKGVHGAGSGIGASGNDASGASVNGAFATGAAPFDLGGALPGKHSAVAGMHAAWSSGGIDMGTTRPIPSEDDDDDTSSEYVYPTLTIPGELLDSKDNVIAFCRVDEFAPSPPSPPGDRRRTKDQKPTAPQAPTAQSPPSPIPRQVPQTAYQSYQTPHQVHQTAHQAHQSAEPSHPSEQQSHASRHQPHQSVDQSHQSAHQSPPSCRPSYGSLHQPHQLHRSTEPAYHEVPQSHRPIHQAAAQPWYQQAPSTSRAARGFVSQSSHQGSFGTTYQRASESANQGSAARAHVGTDAQPHGGRAVQPHADLASQPHVARAVQPHGGSAAQPHVGYDARSFTGPAARPYQGSPAQTYPGSPAQPYQGSPAQRLQRQAHQRPSTQASQWPSVQAYQRTGTQTPQRTPMQPRQRASFHTQQRPAEFTHFQRPAEGRHQWAVDRSAYPKADEVVHEQFRHAAGPGGPRSRNRATHGFFSTKQQAQSLANGHFSQPQQQQHATGYAWPQQRPTNGWPQRRTAYGYGGQQPKAR